VWRGIGWDCTTNAPGVVKTGFWGNECKGAEIPPQSVLDALESLAVLFPIPREEELGGARIDASIEPTEDELQDLSRACDRLWDLDSNRLTPGVDYQIDVQKGKKAYKREDVASRKLFKVESQHDIPES